MFAHPSIAEMYALAYDHLTEQGKSRNDGDVRALVQKWCADRAEAGEVIDVTVDGMTTYISTDAARKVTIPAEFSVGGFRLQADQPWGLISDDKLDFAERTVNRYAEALDVLLLEPAPDSQVSRVWPALGCRSAHIITVMAFPLIERAFDKTGFTPYIGVVG